MRRLREFLKRHTLWAGFLAVLAPLLILLSMQYIWLSRLERVSAIAHKAALNNYLDVVGTEVEYFYKSLAERTLSLSPSLISEGHLKKVAWQWKKKGSNGAKRLFLVDFTRDSYGNFYVYDPVKDMLTAAPGTDESWAIIVACVPWQMLSTRGAKEESPTLRVDERDPKYRFILNPITDEKARLVGVAGLILDEKYFRYKFLPSILTKTLPAYFPEVPKGDLAVTVRNEEGKVVLASSDHKVHGDMATSRFPFVFTGWTVSLHSLGSTPEQWARASFMFNMTLSTLIAVVLIGGVALALREANRVMRLSEMKADFVSNVSHELRTPLASVRVFGEFLKLGRASSPEKVREYGEYIETESRRLSRLIDNILDFSRIESGQKTYEFLETELEGVLDSTLATFEVRTRQSGFDVELIGPGSPLPPVRIDPDAIGQALHNLLDNAVKYSGDSRKITVRLFRENDSVVISVQDGGIGIARDEQKKIFERFHRVGTGAIHDVKGSGLGLSIVHHIVRAHRGTVTVESELGKGSTFSVRLPAGFGPGGPVGAEAGSAAAPEAPGLPSGAGK